MFESNHQHTLKNRISASGIGLHSGKTINLTLAPAPANSGITFVRTDIDGFAVAASPQHVGSTVLATSLQVGVDSVATIEHLMATFAGLGVDNALVEVDAAELPIMDGSASPFVFMLESAGIAEQPATRQVIRVLAPIQVRDGDAFIRLEPCDASVFSYSIDYDHPVFKAHAPIAQVTLNSAVFKKEICRARTFGFLDEVEKMQAMNLAMGGSLENAVVMDRSKILNQGGLRAEDEFAKHKILDAIGDCYLLGHQLIGRFSGHKSGHRLNNELLRQLLAAPDAYAIVDRCEVSPMSAQKAQKPHPASVNG